MFERTTLFQAPGDGYAAYRIPALAVTATGTLLAYCEARRNARGDWGAIDILQRRSQDGGRTWSALQKMNRLREPVPKNAAALAQGLAGPDEHTFHNPVPIAGARPGEVHFLYGAEYARCFYLRSDDDGRTWSDPADITAVFEAFRPEYDWRVIATGPGHGIRLRNGRLLVPVWLSAGTGGHAHRPSCVSAIYSDDSGRTWQRGDIVVRHSERFPNPSESAALELHDGRVLLNMRNESRRHRRLIAYSADGATGWTAPAFDEGLREPVCCAGLVGLNDGRSILFANPSSNPGPGAAHDEVAWPRENLTVRLSTDQGRTWPVARVVDAGSAGYSDLAAGPDGTLYCLYEGNASDHTAHVTLARFDLAWLSG